MANLAIKGHASRGKEVIEILEMLGGRNIYKLCGDRKYAYYEVECGVIHASLYIYGNEPHTFFTLEEFIEKYPYKIGDKVDYIKYDDEDFSVYEIIGMKWTGSTIEYALDCFGFTCLTKDIRLHKENNMNKNFKSLNVETYLKVWDETENGLEVCVAEGYEMIEKKGKFYIVKQKTKYPTTYEECARLLNTYCGSIGGYNWKLLSYFQQLIVCRDAYWKIAGEQMGLGEPWKPDYINPDIDLYVIINIYNRTEKAKYGYGFQQCILSFPSKEMRDIFFDNFKELIEQCKELLYLTDNKRII